MHKGTYFQNNWLMGALAVLILLTVIGLASLGDGLSLEAGGVQMTLDLAASDGAHVSFVRAG